MRTRPSRKQKSKTNHRGAPYDGCSVDARPIPSIHCTHQKIFSLCHGGTPKADALRCIEFDARRLNDLSGSKSRYKQRGEFSWLFSNSPEQQTISLYLASPKGTSISEKFVVAIFVNGSALYPFLSVSPIYQVTDIAHASCVECKLDFIFENDPPQGEPLPPPSWERN